MLQRKPTGVEPLGALLAAGALAGCVTVAPAPAPAQHFLPYQLAPQTSYREARPLPPPPPPPTAETLPSSRINAALVRFAVSQRSTRNALAKGALMPPSVQREWTEVLAAVDTFVRLPPEQVLALDVVRARVALEAELEMDLGHWSKVPPVLVSSVRARAMGLDHRLVLLRRQQQRQSAPARLAQLIWPLSPVVVTSLFGIRTDPFDGSDKPHMGVDLKARSGQLVQAAGQGVVTRAEKAGGHGLHVEVLHDDGLITGYSHLSMILVTVGMRVPAGGALGLAGSTGRSTGPHLHFEVWRNGRAVDPLSELVDPAFQEISDANVGSGE